MTERRRARLVRPPFIWRQRWRRTRTGGTGQDRWCTARCSRPAPTHHFQHATSLAALDDAVQRDLRRAAQLVEPTLTTLDRNPR